MSKYSCFLQGQTDKAWTSLEFARRRQSDTAAIRRIFQKGLPPYSRLLLVGDSTMRQVFIAMSCISLSVHGGGDDDDDIIHMEYKVDWEPSWPCHGVPHCVEEGPHGGFNRGSLTFPNGAQVHFVPLGGGSLGRVERKIVSRFTRELDTLGRITFGNNMVTEMDKQDRYLNATDTLLFNVGLHNQLGDLDPILKTFANFSDKLRQVENPPKVVYMTSITQHFKTTNGQYDHEKGGVRARAGGKPSCRP
ncbi:MAG: hypothetical protein SGILL_003200 [Bacillariaceae sp.]